MRIERIGVFANLSSYDVFMRVERWFFVEKCRCVFVAFGDLYRYNFLVQDALLKGITFL